MTTKPLPDWRAMTPQDLADLSVADEGAWWALYAAGWGDPAWHAFKDRAAVLAPLEGVTPASERVTLSDVWFDRRWLRTH